MRSVRSKRAPLLGIVVLLATVSTLIGVSAGPSLAVQPVERTLASGVADVNNVQGARWRKVAFTARADSSGTSTLRLSWTGTASMHFAVLNSASTRLASNLTTSNPKSISLTLTPGANYYTTLWAVSGIANFTITITENLPDPVPDPNPVPSGRPNLIVINTDDQRPDTLAYMPKLRAWMQDGGTTFPNAYVSTPSCCPSRASLMSGRYVHNNGQFQQLATGFSLENTTQRYLKEAGYFTGHAGKFLHWLPLNQRAPYWDRWTYFKGGYYGVAMRMENSTVTTTQNSTIITFEKGMEYITDFESRDDSKPFYLNLAPIAPHGPSTPEPQYSTTPVPEMAILPSHDEVDRTDKPDHVQSKNISVASAIETRANMIRTLYTVDDQFDLFMRHLEAAGELDNTLIIYTSDNGYFWGEHKLQSKFRPYTESVNVPFMIRWPGKVTPGVSDPRQVTHVDVAPTLLAAAGTSQNSVVFDGRNIMTAPARERAYMEYYYDSANNNGITTWASIRTATYQYVEYYGSTNAMDVVSFREYYDLVNDPYQMVNLYNDGDSTNNPDTVRLSAELAAAKTCVGSACP